MGQTGEDAWDARRFACELAAQLPHVVGVALGGSRLANHSQIDRFSDVDLFFYLRGSTLPAAAVMTQQLGIPENQLRRLSSYLEFKELGPFTTNIKFFSVETMRSYIERIPSLDEQYLEEMESYQGFEVLTDPDGELAELLTRARAKRASDTEVLGHAALERYGKAINWAVRQGVDRSDHTTAFMAMTLAVNSLLCLIYLMSGYYPPSVKWRASQRLLETVENGSALHLTLARWSTSLADLEITSGLQAIQEMETLVAGSYDRPPWSHQLERWWWRNYQPR